MFTVEQAKVFIEGLATALHTTAQQSSNPFTSLAVHAVEGLIEEEEDTIIGILQGLQVVQASSTK